MIHDAALPGTPGEREPDVEAGEKQLRVALLLGQHGGVRVVLSPVACQDTVVGIFVIDQRRKQCVGEIHTAGLRGDEPTHAGHGKERRDDLFSDDPSPGQSTGALQLRLREPTKGIVVVKHTAADDRAATRSHDRCLEPKVNPSGLRATGTIHQTWRQCRRTFEVREPAEFRNVNDSARAKRRAIHYRQAATCAGGRQAMCLSRRVEMGYVGQ
jgi:hypothetical protein